ncbi:hypothetical protein V8E53_011416 [Lactarius tabidus]
MDEVDGLRKRYDEASKWALAAEPSISTGIQWKVGASQAHAAFGQQLEHEVIANFKPLRVVLNRNGREQVVVNGRGLLHMEHFREKTIEEPKVETSEEGSEMQEVLKVNPNAWFEDDSEDAYGEESFVSWEDTKPKHKLEHISSSSDFNTSHQVPNPCPSTSISLTTAMSTVSPSMPPLLTSLPLLAKTPSLRILIASIMPTFLSILRLLRHSSMVRFR